jgi:hypothetical protein
VNAKFIQRPGIAVKDEVYREVGYNAPPLIGGTTHGIFAVHRRAGAPHRVNEKSLPDALPLREAEGVGIATIQGLVKAQNPL